MNSSEWLRYLHDLNDYISCIWIWEQIMTLELVAIFEWAFWSLALWRPPPQIFTPPNVTSPLSLVVTHLIWSRLEVDFIMQHFLEATITMSHGTQLHPTQLYCQNSKRSTHLKWFKLKIHNFHNFITDMEATRCHGSDKSQQKISKTSSFYYFGLNFHKF